MSESMFIHVLHTIEFLEPRNQQCIHDQLKQMIQHQRYGPVRIGGKEMAPNVNPVGQCLLRSTKNHAVRSGQESLSKPDVTAITPKRMTCNATQAAKNLRNNSPPCRNLSAPEAKPAYTNSRMISCGATFKAGRTDSVRSTISGATIVRSKSAQDDQKHPQHHGARVELHCASHGSFQNEGRQENGQ